MTITQKLSYGMYAVTTFDGAPRGCIANCAVQITSQPATVAVSINHDNFTNTCIKNTRKFAVSVLAEDTDPAIIGTFGFKSGRDTDKFAGVKYATEAGEPVLLDSCGYIVCDVIDTMETDTHTVFLGKIVKSDVFGDRAPMTYAYYHKVIKGSSPKNAPTYVPPERADASAPQQPQAKRTRKFVCSICGYEYEGEGLPEGFACPICGVGPEMFEEVK